MGELNVKEGLAVQYRMYERMAKYPKKSEDGSQKWFHKVGNKYISMLSGATSTHMLVLVQTNIAAPEIRKTRYPNRAVLFEKYPNDMWEFTSTDPAEVEKQFNDLLDTLEKE